MGRRRTGVRSISSAYSSDRGEKSHSRGVAAPIFRCKQDLFSSAPLLLSHFGMSAVKLNRQNRAYALNHTKFLLDPEFIQLQVLLLRSLHEDERNVLLLLVAIHTGARASEILAIRKKDLNRASRSVFVQGIKGSADRDLPLPPRLFQRLLDYAEHRCATQLLFPISYTRLCQIWHWYRPTNKSFHSLRHTFALKVYRQSRDIKLLQIALGHRNINNTMIYADFVYTMEELRRILF